MKNRFWIGAACGRRGSGIPSTMLFFSLLVGVAALALGGNGRGQELGLPMPERVADAVAASRPPGHRGTLMIYCHPVLQSYRRAVERVASWSSQPGREGVAIVFVPASAATAGDPPLPDGAVSVFDHDLSIYRELTGHERWYDFQAFLFDAEGGLLHESLSLDRSLEAAQGVASGLLTRDRVAERLRQVEAFRGCLARWVESEDHRYLIEAVECLPGIGDLEPWHRNTLLRIIMEHLHLARKLEVASSLDRWLDEACALRPVPEFDISWSRSYEESEWWPDGYIDLRNAWGGVVFRQRSQLYYLINIGLCNLPMHDADGASSGCFEWLERSFER